MTTGSRLSAILLVLQVAFVHSSPADYGQQYRREEAAVVVEDVFKAMSFDRPPASILTRDDHPQPPVGVNQKGPLQTNKFYASFFANNQDNRTWTYPYSVWWPRNQTSQGHGLSGGFPATVF